MSDYFDAAAQKLSPLRLDSSNRPLEWTGPHQFPSLTQNPSLPLRGSVREMGHRLPSQGVV